MLAPPVADRQGAPATPSTDVRPGQPPGRQPLQLLQRSIGNRAVLRLASPASIRIQPKLTVGGVDDPCEREADQAADRVMAISDASVTLAAGRGALQRKCSACDEDDERLHRSPASGANHSPVISDAVHETLATSGQPLNLATRAFFETRFGHDFGDVRVHADSLADASARSLNATAYTVGEHVVFRRGAFSPETTEGKRLLAHELTHTLQQRQATLRIQRTVETSAGSCTGYGDAAATGVRAHAVIGAMCGCSAAPSLPGGGENGGWGYLDLFQLWPMRQARLFGLDPADSPSPAGAAADVAEIGEIKPDSYLTDAGKWASAQYQLQRYFASFNRAFGPGNPLGLPPRTVVPMQTFRGIPWPGIPFGGPNQYLTCGSVGNGLYIYSCDTKQRTKEEQRAGADARRRAELEEGRTATAAPRGRPVITQFEPEIRAIRPLVDEELRNRFSPAAGESDYLIVAPWNYFEAAVLAPKEQRFVDRYQPVNPRLDARSNPVAGYRNLGLTLSLIFLLKEAELVLVGPIAFEVMAELAALGAAVGVDAAVAGEAVIAAESVVATEAAVTEGAVLVEAAAVGEVAATTAAAPALEAWMISALQSEAARSSIRLTGALLAVVVARKASAATGGVDSSDAIRALPVNAVAARRADEPIDLMTEVLYDGRKYYVIGRASYTPPTAR
jgi:hypothetical protein